MSIRRFRIGVAIAFLVLVAIGVRLWTLIEQNGPNRDLLVALYSGVLGALIGAIATLGLAWIAGEQLIVTGQQLREVARTTSSDFVLRLKSDFFRTTTRTLVSLVANEWLRFVEHDEHENAVDIPYFEVREEAVRHARLPDLVKGRLRARHIYTAFDMDDLLLGPLDDVATLWERGTLEFDLVRDMFGWYVEVVWDDRDVHAYVAHQQLHEDPAIYAALGRLREALRPNNAEG